MTFRGVRGFFRWGAKRDCGGAYCTTWEFMKGALVENSMYGLLYAAECAWNPQSISRREFDRRFGAWWFGLDAKDAALCAQTLFQPVETDGNRAAFANAWRDSRPATRLLWIAPKDVMQTWVMRTPRAIDKARDLTDSMNAAIARMDQIGKRARRHPLTLRAAKLAFEMMRYAGNKPLQLHQATTQYEAARKAATTVERAKALRAVARCFEDLAAEARQCAKSYRYFVDHCGAWKGDFDGLEKQADSLEATETAMKKLADRIASGDVAKLPSGAAFGLVSGHAVRIGRWSPDTVTEKGVTLRFRIAPSLLKNAREIEVSWEYKSGAHGLWISASRLRCDGKVISEDHHPGWAGSGTHNNTYRLAVKAIKSGAVCEIEGDVASSGGRDSRGEVWMLSTE